MPRVMTAFITCALLLFCSYIPAGFAQEPLDYGLLSHKLAITLLRAGNHDPSGTNEYTFKATMYGLLNSPEERNIDFSKRKKITVELGHFGDTTLEALNAWRPDDKAEDAKELRIEGQQIRELVARAMTELKAKESEITVMVELVLFEKNKRFFFLGEDQEITKASYHPIAPTKFDTPPRANSELSLTDDKGTMVLIAVLYDTPLQASIEQKNAPTSDVSSSEN